MFMTDSRKFLLRRRRRAYARNGRCGSSGELDTRSPEVDRGGDLSKL